MYLSVYLPSQLPSPLTCCFDSMFLRSYSITLFWLSPLCCVSFIFTHNIFSHLYTRDIFSQLYSIICSSVHILFHYFPPRHYVSFLSSIRVTYSNIYIQVTYSVIYIQVAYSISYI